MPRYGLKITITAMLLIVAIMLVAYKVYQPPPPAEAPPPAPDIPKPQPSKPVDAQPGQPGAQEQPSGGGPQANVTVNATQPGGEGSLQYARNLARITATISQPAEGQAAEAVEDVVTTRPTLNIDLGFLRSVKPILLEAQISGSVVDVQLVDINGYCVKCGLLITVDTGGGIRYVLAMGAWEADDRIVNTVNLLLYIHPGDQIEIEALRNSYQYKGDPLYIAYEIKVLNTGVELERITHHYRDDIHHEWEG